MYSWGYRGCGSLKANSKTKELSSFKVAVDIILSIFRNPLIISYVNERYDFLLYMILFFDD